MSLQPPIQIDEANAWLAKIDDAVKRCMVASILDEIQRFYSADPSGLETPCDLAFVCKVLDYDLENILNLLRGFVDPALYWTDELPILTAAPRRPQRDSTRHARRVAEAEEYCALHSDEWMATVLMSFLSSAQIIVRATEPTFRYGGPPVPAALPAEPLDHLFLVRALDYALRPDGPVRTMIQAHESSHKRSEDV